jgi:hypothetical protein
LEVGVKDAFAIARRLGDSLYFCGTCAACNSCARAISFFELAFDRSIADVLLLQHSVRVNRERVRDRPYSGHFCDWPSESAVAVFRPAHFVLADELFPRWSVSRLTLKINYPGYVPA